MNGDGDSPYRDLEIVVARNKVSFRVDDDCEGVPELDEIHLNRLSELRASDPMAYGRELCQAAFRDGAADGLKTLIQKVNHDGIRWRIRLNIDINQPELHQVWWECLYHEDPIPWLMARSRSTPLSRYLSGGGRKVVRGERLKVLMVISNPKDLGTGDFKHLPMLDPAAEEAVLRDALKGLADRIELKVQDAPASPPAIRRRLRDEGFHVLHVVAHGMLDPDRRGHLLLERDEDEKALPVSESKVADMVDYLDRLHLVILASCHSAERSDRGAFIGMGPSVVGRGVPAVIAMQDRIPEAAARAFTSTFYRQLGRAQDVGGLVDVATNDARDDMYMESMSGDQVGWQWAMPVLFMRGDGQVFDPGSAPPLEQSEATESRRGLGVDTAPAPTAGPVAETAVPATEVRAAEKLMTTTTVAADPAEAQRQLLVDQLWTTDDEVNYLFVYFNVPGEPTQLSFATRVRALVEFLLQQGRADQVSSAQRAFRERSGTIHLPAGRG
jgi:hypothetical protein